MANVAIDGLDTLTRLEEVGEYIVKDIDVRPLAGRVGSQDPHQISGKDVNSELLLERGLACILVGTEEVPLLCNPLLLDTVVGTVDCHQTIILHVVFKWLSNTICGFARETVTKNDVRGDARQDNNTIKNLPLCLPAR